MILYRNAQTCHQNRIGWILQADISASLPQSIAARCGAVQAWCQFSDVHQVPDVPAAPREMPLATCLTHKDPGAMITHSPWLLQQITLHKLVLQLEFATNSGRVGEQVCRGKEQYGDDGHKAFKCVGISHVIHVHGARLQ